MWEEPVLNDCFVNENPNDVLFSIAKSPVTAENVTEYSSDLVAITEDGDVIDAEGLIAAATALEQILAVANPSLEVTINVIEVVDNILSVETEVYTSTVGAGAPTKILDALEGQLTLSQLNGDGTNLTVIGENTGVVALQLSEASLDSGLGFATLPSGSANSMYDSLSENLTMVYFDNIPEEIVEASILLPLGITDHIPPIALNGTIPVSFIIFQTSKLFQGSEQQYELGRGRRLAVGTPVISATIEGVVIDGLPVGQEIYTSFLELKVTTGDETVDNRSCVFWEKRLDGGLWSSEGCRREDLPRTNMTRCLCDHLTSFAVLLDISGDAGLIILDMLSVIGCVISIICLVITLITYLSMKKFRMKQPQQILINLCFALLGLYVIFVIGIDRRYPTVGCVVVGFLIHFFLLSSVAWMLVEAVNMYLMFVKVFNATVSRFILKARLGAWGCPLVVCIIIVAVDSSLYLGDDTYCFVKPGPALYCGVFIIVGVLLAFNFAVFGLVMQRLTCRRSVSTHKSQQVDRSEAWRRVKNAAAISVLLGLTWIFGFLAIGGARTVFNILFLVFNSLQGLFVFVMFCLRQQDVRHQWARWMRCQFEAEKPGHVKSNDKKTATHSGSATSTDDRLSFATSAGGMTLSSSGTVSTDKSSAAAP